MKFNYRSQHIRRALFEHFSLELSNKATDNFIEAFGKGESDEQMTRNKIMNNIHDFYDFVLERTDIPLNKDFTKEQKEIKTLTQKLNSFGRTIYLLEKMNRADAHSSINYIKIIYNEVFDECLEIAKKLQYPDSWLPKYKTRIFNRYD